MNSLVKVQPSDIRHLADSTLFYFGTSKNIFQLPGLSKFEIVYSPRPPQGWEFVQYQVFEGNSGITVLGRRGLEADEIAYFEKLLATSKTRGGVSAYVAGNAAQV